MQFIQDVSLDLSRARQSTTAGHPVSTEESRKKGRNGKGWRRRGGEVWQHSEVPFYDNDQGTYEYPRRSGSRPSHSALLCGHWKQRGALRFPCGATFLS